MKKRNAKSQQCARKRALDRSGKICQKCGAAGYVIVHHIIPIADGGTHRNDNLIMLCDTCHREAHGWKKRRPGIAIWVDQEMGRG